MPPKTQVDFVIIGAMRARTTSLHYELAQHPLISMSRTKETDYFLPEIFAKTAPERYHEQFDPTKPFWGEAAPNYTKCDIFPGVPQRLAAHSPMAKLIFIARDPVGRLISHYYHALYLGRPVPSPDELLRSSAGEHMLNVSRYHLQLSAYCDYFPRDAFLILDETIFDRPCAHGCETIADFIGAPRFNWNETHKKVNSTAKIMNTPKLMQKMRQLPLAKSLFARLPLTMQCQLKSIRFNKSQSNLPIFTKRQQNEIWQRLAEDIAAFSRNYAFDTSHWSAKYAN